MTAETVDDEAIEEPKRDELLQEVERKRVLTGRAAVAVAAIGILFSAFQLWLAARSFQFRFTLPVVGRIDLASLQLLQANAIHVAFALVLAFLIFPTTQGRGVVSRRLARVVPFVRGRFGDDSPLTGIVSRLRGGVRWAAVDPDATRVTPADLVLCVLILLTPLYMLTEFDEIRRMRVRGLGAGRPINEVYPVTDPVVSALASIGIPLGEYSYAVVLGTVGVLLVLEATRRALGLMLTALVTSFIVYAMYGYLIPRGSFFGALSIPPTRWASLIRDLWFNTEAGIFGIPVTVSLRFIYIFILFGAFLEMSGAGQWFIDFAYSLTGSRRGGPAKSSVVASGFMGMLSGSSIANTVTTGAFTIPLMKRSGYSPEFSGAVESSASSGGQILPPVMGAAAFLIVEFTQTPYAEVIIAATLPAIAFFFGMWVMVHFEAVRGGIGGLDPAELANPLDLLKGGWFYLAPIVILLYFLVWLRLSVARAGWFTIVALIALVALIAAYSRRTRGPLLGTILVLLAVQAASYAVYGVGVIDALVVLLGGEGAAGLPLTEALREAASNLGIVIILASLVAIALRPGTDSPLLDLDPAVDTAAEKSARAIGRPSLADNAAYRLGAFVLKSMDAGARTATTVVVAVAAAGVIPGVISVTGLGPNLTSLILSVSGQSLLGLLLLTGVSAIIFGMGMPTTVMYIILVAMLGPAIEQFGIAILAAHLYILYFGLMADVTPPVAVAAFAAAGIAKADEFKTAWRAFLLSLNKIMVPFAFVFSPGILLLRSSEDGISMVGWGDVVDPTFFVPEVVIPVFGMFLGVYALGVTIIGYQYTDVGDVRRGFYAIASMLLMVPEVFLLPAEAAFAMAGIDLTLTGMAIEFGLRLVGLVILVAFTVQNRRRAEADAEVEPPAVPGDA